MSFHFFESSSLSFISVCSSQHVSLLHIILVRFSPKYCFVFDVILEEFCLVLLPPLSCHFCFAWNAFFPFLLSLLVYLPLKWVSCRPACCRLLFVFNPLSHILTRAFSPLPFKATTDWYVLPLYTVKCMCCHFRPLFSSRCCFRLFLSFVLPFAVWRVSSVWCVCPFCFCSVCSVSLVCDSLSRCQFIYFGQWGSRQAGSRAPAFSSLALIKPWDRFPTLSPSKVWVHFLC